MNNCKRVVITGVNGFIGNKVRQCLENSVWDVWGIDIKRQNIPKVIIADLLNEEATKVAFAAIPPPYIIVHTAALAHGQQPPKGETCHSFNTKITMNILKACQTHIKGFVFLSSIAVYGEDGRKEPIKVSDECRPSTEYGQSKLECEKIIISSGCLNISILRPAPVFDTDHMNDVNKRVKCPGLDHLAIKIIPEPSYSFCHITRIVQKILECINEQKEGVKFFNVADQKPFRQHELLKNTKKRITLPFFIPLFSPFYYATYLIPGNTGYKIRSIYWKLFRSNVVEV